MRALLCIAAAPSVHAMRHEHLPQRRRFPVPLAEASLLLPLCRFAALVLYLAADGRHVVKEAELYIPATPPFPPRNFVAIRTLCVSGARVRACAYAHTASAHRPHVLCARGKRVMKSRRLSLDRGYVTWT